MEKYQSWYNKIIAHYAGFDKPDLCERHHIVPRSLGGSDEESNIVSVSPRVHYVLHLLLYKMTSGEDKSKMWFAVWNMSHQGKVKTGSMYQFIREQTTQKHSEMMKGKTPWNKGKKGYKLNVDRKGKVPHWTLKPIQFEGVVYPSVKDAVEKSGRSYYIVSTRGKYIT